MSRLRLHSYRDGAGFATGGVVTDPAATSWAAQVVANGGSVSAPRLATVSQFITAEKASGCWALTDDYLGFWGENVPQALTSLKQRRLALAVAGPTFVANRHYLFDGVASYIDTNFIPATHAVAMTFSNVRCAIYERTNVDGAVSLGATTSNPVIIQLGARFGTQVSVRLTEDTYLVYNLSVVDSSGYTAASQSGLSTAGCFAYKNGVSLSLVGVTPGFGAALPACNMYVGTLSSNNFAQFFRASSVGLVVFGAQLSPAQEIAQYNAVQAWATAIGANV